MHGTLCMCVIVLNSFFIVYAKWERLFFFVVEFLPDMWEKHCVKVVTTNPDDSAVASNTDETLAPTPAPAAAPQTMKTYKNDAKHSAIIDLENKKKAFRHPHKIYFKKTIMKRN